MNTLMKILTGILGILAVIACVATIGIIGYSMMGGGFEKEENADTDKQYVEATVEATPFENPENSEEAAVPTQEPVQTDVIATDPNHIHDYEEEIEKKATCYRAGRLKYVCDCGDSYYVDIPSTGHVEDVWKVQREATKEQDGLRVMRCIYCDEIVAQEVIPYESKESDKDETHYHTYTASIDREPSCILAGLRKYSCVCGSFYTEKIAAMGHVVSDWTVAEAPTTTTLGREQRICNVCGVVVDSRPVSMLTASPAASGSASPSASASASATPTATTSATTTPSASPSSTASASATPGSSHSHSYTSYVLKESTCTEKGMRSFVCTCGSSYAELIELDPNNHSYTATITSPTSNSGGFTTYTCIWCAYSYVDDYTPAIK